LYQLLRHNYNTTLLICQALLALPPHLQMLANTRSHARNASIPLFFVLTDQFPTTGDACVFFPIVNAKGLLAADPTISFANVMLANIVTALADARAAHQCDICAIRDRAFFTRAFCFLVNANAWSPIALRACVFLPFVDTNLTPGTWNTSAAKPVVLAVTLRATDTASIFPDIVHTRLELALFGGFVRDGNDLAGVYHLALSKPLKLARHWYNLTRHASRFDGPRNLPRLWLGMHLHSLNVAGLGRHRHGHWQCLRLS